MPSKQKVIVLIKLHLFQFLFPTGKSPRANLKDYWANPTSKLFPRGSPPACWSEANEEMKELCCECPRRNAELIIHSRPTCVCQLPADGQHDLAIPRGIGHQFQHLFVRLALNGNAVYTQQLISGSQTAVLLGCTEWNNGADVHLKTKSKWSVLERAHQPVDVIIRSLY